MGRKTVARAAAATSGKRCDPDDDVAPEILKLAAAIGRDLAREHHELAKLGIDILDPDTRKLMHRNSGEVPRVP